MAVTGHVTSRMVAHYTKDASKKKQATAAILKLENAQVIAECQTRSEETVPNGAETLEIQKHSNYHGGPYGSRTRLSRLKISRPNR